MEENNNHHQNHDDHDQDQDRDEDDQERGSTVGGARWNPTKEQIGILERMYSEGVRTPSADQIQQITARLRVYGHIEGKNVFYWFQNHKARQRQKLRQERLAAAAAASTHHHMNMNMNMMMMNNPHFVGPHRNNVNNINLNPRPICPAAPPLNYRSDHRLHPHYHIGNQVICSSYYLPQTNPGFYSQHHPQYHYSAPAADHLISPTARSKPLEMPRGGGVPVPPDGYCSPMVANTTTSSSDHHNHHQHHEDHGVDYMGVRTLDLFPVHPTGILEHKLGGTGCSTNNNNSGEIENNNSSANTCSSSDDTHHMMNVDNGGGDMQQRIIDFFSSSGRSCF